jgi:hypothetical protein
MYPRCEFGVATEGVERGPSLGERVLDSISGLILIQITSGNPKKGAGMVCHERSIIRFGTYRVDDGGIGGVQLLSDEWLPK